MLITIIIITAGIFFFLRSQENYYHKRAMKGGNVKDINSSDEFGVWKVFVAVLLWVEVVVMIIKS